MLVEHRHCVPGDEVPLWAFAHVEKIYKKKVFKSERIFQISSSK